MHLWQVWRGYKLVGMGDTSHAIGSWCHQRDLNRLEKWADRKLKQIKEGKCKILDMGRYKLRVLVEEKITTSLSQHCLQ